MIKYLCNTIMIKKYLIVCGEGRSSKDYIVLQGVEGVSGKGNFLNVPYMKPIFVVNFLFDINHLLTKLSNKVALKSLNQGIIIQ